MGGGDEGSHASSAFESLDGYRRVSKKPTSKNSNASSISTKSSKRAFMDKVELFRDEFFHDDNSSNGSSASGTKKSARRGFRGQKKSKKSQMSTSTSSYGDGSHYSSFDDKQQNFDGNEDEEDEIYLVRQDCAVLSYGFSFVQTIIMGLLMWQCGMAPMNINPMVGPYPDALSEWGGKNATLIVDDGEWWRLLTPIFLHAGWFHLMGNVAVQVEAGAFFEKEWGSVRWLIIYLGSAVASSTLSVICMPEAVSVGSSGAVMGLFGGKLAEVILRCCEHTDTPEKQMGSKVRREQCLTVTCSVVVVLAFSFIPYVDWAAHLGGLLGGIVVGIGVFALDLEYRCCQLVWFILGLAISFGTYFGAVWYMYNGDVDISEDLRDVCGYYKQQFEDYECRCMVEQYRNGQGGGAEGENRFM